MAQSSTSFVNQNWTIDTTTQQQNTFSDLSLDITIWQNTAYSTYVTYLSGSESSAIVDENTAYLTGSMRSNFSSLVGTYDDYSIQVKMGFTNAFSTTNQAVAFCMHHKDYGTQCGTASTGSGSSSESQEFRTYWFPIGTVDITTTIKDDDPLDLWNASYDTYKISDYYYGLT